MTPRTWSAVLAVWLTGLVAPVVRAAPNVIVVVTDDQRWDDLFVMRTVTGMLSESVRFTNAFVTTAECAPSRASLLSGLYAHNHGVRTLDGTLFVGPDMSTVATWLHARGYRTAMVGKYLNGYVTQGPPARPTWYVPPGWDVWRALRDEAYYDYTIVDETGGETAHGSAPEDYSTDVLREHALAFLREALTARRPFLLYFAPYAPHVAWPELDPLPAPRHVGLLLGTAPLRPPSFMVEDIDGPPEDYLFWLGPQFLDPDRIKRLESLLAVDEAVAAFLATIKAAGVDRRTVIVFTSDNGYLLGEHRLLGKLLPYEEAHRVPLVIWDPRHVRAERTDAHLVLIEDIAPTIADIAHAKRQAADGQSLRPLLQNHSVPWRTSFPLESWYESGALQYRGAHTTRWTYDERANEDAEELYDLSADPYELQNLSGESAAGASLGTMRSLTSSLHAGE
jgi:arylsulfatase A-like enzyme